MKHKNKYFESDQEGYIRTYPSIHETKEKGKLRIPLKVVLAVYVRLNCSARRNPYA
jgi:hypothetical protein